MISIIPSNKSIVSSIALAVFLALALFSIKPTPIAGEPGRYDYGSEYANLATSIVEGHGYGNVFAANSGPSAWQPPAVTFLFAGIFFLFGVKSSASLWVFGILRILCLVGATYFSVSIIEMTKLSRYRGLFAFIFIGLTVFNYKLLISRIDDVAITIFLGTITIYQVIALIKGQLKHKTWLYILAVLLPLSQPSFSMIFVAGIAAYFLANLWYACNKNGRFSLATLLGEGGKILRPALITSAISATLFVSAVISWASYNYSVFEKPVLFKSNMWFEFYLANVLDDDGILSRQTFSSYHPFKQAPLLDDYLKNGEMAFLDTAKARSMVMLSENPEIYYQKIRNRVANAFIYTQSVFDIAKIDEKAFTGEQLTRLQDIRLIANENWLCLKWPKQKVITEIEAAGILDHDHIMTDWEEKKASTKKQANKLINLIRGSLLSIIPTLCFFIALFFSKARGSLVFGVVSLTYVLHLVPYLLVSHFERYQLSIVSLQALLIFFPLAAFLQKFEAARLKKEQTQERVNA